MQLPRGNRRRVLKDVVESEVGTTRKRIKKTDEQHRTRTRDGL
jgi:hypothetical protein